MGRKNISFKHYEEFHRNTECLPDVIVQQLIADVPLEPFEKYIDTIMGILEPTLEKARNYTHQLKEDAAQIYASETDNIVRIEKFNSEHIPLTPNLSPTNPSLSNDEKSSDFS